MPRSVKKGPYVDHHLAKKVDAAVAANSKRPIFVEVKIDEVKVNPLKASKRAGR